MLYEYLLTFDDERELIWHGKMTASTWIFLANRIVMLVTILDTVLANAGPVVS